MKLALQQNQLQNKEQKKKNKENRTPNTEQKKMANTTDYQALYEALEKKVYDFTKNVGICPKYLTHNVSECSANGVLDFIIAQYKKQQERIEELEGLMEDMYDEDGAVAERHRLGLVLEDDYNKLKEENKKLKGEWEILNEFCPKEAENNGQAVVDWISKFFTIEDKFYELEKENKKLKEFKELSEVDEKTIELRKEMKVLDKENAELVKKILSKQKVEESDDEEYEITEENIIRDYGDESEQAKKYGFGMFNPEYVLRLQEKEKEDEDEKDKYDGDDWHWVYGKMTVKNDDGFKDVVLCMAGGGSHWENWIMRPNMNYIENKDGLHPQHGQVIVQSSCGKYVSFQDKDYECEGDECICEYEDCVDY